MVNDSWKAIVLRCLPCYNMSPTSHRFIMVINFRSSAATWYFIIHPRQRENWKRTNWKSGIRGRMGIKKHVFLYQNTKKLSKESVQRIARCFDLREETEKGIQKTNCWNGIVSILKRESLRKKTWQSGKVRMIKIHWNSNWKSAQNPHRKLSWEWGQEISMGKPNPTFDLSLLVISS